MTYEELNQVLRIADRERAEQDRIDERKDLGGGRYSNGYQKHGD